MSHTRTARLRDFVTPERDLVEIGAIFIDHVRQFNTYLKGEPVNGRQFFANTYFPFIYSVQGSVVVQKNFEDAVDIMERMLQNQRESNVTSCELKRIDFKSVGSTAVLVSTIVAYKRNESIIKEDRQTHLYCKMSEKWMATNTCM